MALLLKLKCAHQFLGSLVIMQVLIQQSPVGPENLHF